MEHADAQKKLNFFYAKAIEALNAENCFSQAEQNILSAPFLIQVQEHYFRAPVKIIFIGQETRGWLEKLGKTLQREDSVSPLLDRYSNQLKMPKWKSSLLKKYRWLEQELGAGVRGSIVWSNVNKMDVDRGKGKTRNSREYSEHLEKFSEKLFRYEVEVLKPDVMIFGCSYTHDPVIKRYFPHYQTQPGGEPYSLWKFNVGDTYCYRTWHPSTIKHRGTQSIKNYYQEIIEDVKTKFPEVYA